jgi:hypothetical protein
LILLLGYGFIQSGFAQNNDSLETDNSIGVIRDDTLNTSVSTDTIPDNILYSKSPADEDTIKTSMWPAFIRSAIIPGWGQIEQEHPARAVAFYGLSLTFLYNIAYNYYWYQETKSYSRKVKLRRYTIFFIQLYALNLVDIYETHRRGDDKPWSVDMFSDQPLKSPWGAVARSAMLPGWGQCYNESYIKSVIAFGTFAYFLSRIITYEKQYRDTGNTEFRDKRSTNTWYLGLTYLIILVDSYVDAYLYRFDDTIKLTYQYIPEEKAFTFGVNIEF